MLRAAGFATVKLDAELRGTWSADRLVTLGQHRLLVEIKSASGEASENLVTALERHLLTWPELRPQDPVDGAVLIINDQHKKVVAERAPQIYKRREFIASLKFPVISTRVLFEWWRASDWRAIQEAMLGATPPTTSSSAVPSTTPSRQQRSRWRLWQRDDTP